MMTFMVTNMPLTLNKIQKTVIKGLKNRLKKCCPALLSPNSYKHKFLLLISLQL